MLAAGEDRKAEELFLEALDSEPATLGACAALLLALRQVRCVTKWWHCFGMVRWSRWSRRGVEMLLLEHT